MVMIDYDTTRWQIYADLQKQIHEQMVEELKCSPAKMLMTKEFYDRHVLGIFNTDNNRHEFLVGGRGCKKMASIRMDYEEGCESPYFLYEKTWRGKNVKDMETDHLMNTVLMLRRRALDFKEQFEIYLMGSKNANPILEPKYDLLEIAKMPTLVWLQSTPMYKQLMDELKERGLDEYLLIIEQRRKENTDGKKND